MPSDQFCSYTNVSSKLIEETLKTMKNEMLSMQLSILQSNESVSIKKKLTVKMNDCCLMPSDQFYSYIMASSKLTDECSLPRYNDNLGLRIDPDTKNNKVHIHW